MDTSSFRAARLTRLFLLVATVGLGWEARAQTILVASNAVWRYLDDGSNQGEVWREFYFEDENWAAGPAELGYGDDVEGRPEATVLNYGGNPNNRFITYYFRHSFYLEDVSLVTNLVARLLRDDGAVVYLNESEVIRSNMPAGPINYLTLASPPGVASGPEEYTFYASQIDPALLLPGWNVLAAEVHQHLKTSADVSFALELLAGVGEPPPVPLVLTRGPYLQGGSPTNVIVRWRTSVPTDSRVQFSTSPVDFGYTVVDPAVSTNHSVNLIGLAPDTKYYYRVGSTGTNLAGGTNHYFVTSPIAGKPTRIWALGDCGTASAAGYQAFDHVRETRAAYEAFTTARRTDLWLLLGDNAYFTGEDSQYQTAIFDIFTNQLPNTVLWSTVGNHEALATASPQLPYTNYVNRVV